jgi:hypothetical protein
MRLQHHVQRASLSIERRQQLGAAIGRRQNAMHEMLKRFFIAVGLSGLVEARFQIPTRTMRVAKARTRRAG